MTPVRRWLLVVLVTAVIVAAPIALRLLPASSSDLTATALQQRIASAKTVAWSGEVHTRGTLRIPAADSFGTISKLLGDDTSLRVWWRGPAHWRIDRIRQTGETDLIRRGGRITSWVFESESAIITPYTAVRLPNASDLLPSRLAARMLSGATEDELSRLPEQRVAGHDAAGLRLTPAGSQTTIDHVDVWADPATGLALQVQVFAGDSARPVLATEVTHLNLETPAPNTVQFSAPPEAKVRFKDAIDVAAGANAFAPFRLPRQVAGLQRRGSLADLGAVGAYGRGPTALIAIPLRHKFAHRVRKQLDTNQSSRTTDSGTGLQVGPLSVLLTNSGDDRATFLLAGTVTPETLRQAAADLRAAVVVTR